MNTQVVYSTLSAQRVEKNQSVYHQSLFFGRNGCCVLRTKEQSYKVLPAVLTGLQSRMCGDNKDPVLLPSLRLVCRKKWDKMTPESLHRSVSSVSKRLLSDNITKQYMLYCSNCFWNVSEEPKLEYVFILKTTIKLMKNTLNNVLLYCFQYNTGQRSFNEALFQFDFTLTHVPTSSDLWLYNSTQWIRLGFTKHPWMSLSAMCVRRDHQTANILDVCGPRVKCRTERLCEVRQILSTKELLQQQLSISCVPSRLHAAWDES